MHNRLCWFLVKANNLYLAKESRKNGVTKEEV